MTLPLGLILATSLSSGTAIPAVNLTIGLRGGAIVIPLVSSPSETLEVSLTSEDWFDTSLDSEVLWMHAARRVRPSWPDPPMITTVHTQEVPGAAAFLVADAPADANGNLVVNGHTVVMHWHDLPSAMPDLRPRSTNRSASPRPPLGTPPLDDPTQSWRCELVAMMQGRSKPQLSRFDSEQERRVATATSGNWRYAMHRLNNRDHGVATQVAALLTSTFETPEGQTAGWLTDPRSIASLLSILIGPDSPADPIEVRTLRWCERQTSMLVWVESDQGDVVKLAAANPSQHTRIAEVSWARPFELPLALAVQPHQIGKESLDPLPEQELQQLLIQVNESHLVLPINRTIPTVEPPGLMMGPFHPTRTLSDVRHGADPPPPHNDRQTFAQLRRLGGQWELMFECRRPTETDQREGDSVTVFLACEHKEVTIVATPDGTASLSDLTFGTTTAHTATQPHAWLCRIVLPGDWAMCENPSIALMRSHADSDSVETWPTPCTPWSIHMDPTHVDLGGWDQDAEVVTP
ncbi:MAG: hypothetical protein GY876_07790 [Planctomycetes bacterium]|nr:hypothetical protein [Planctomycetota bacterium]